MKMTAADVAIVLAHLVESGEFEDVVENFTGDDELPAMSARSFGEANLLTKDEGLVLKVGDREFQITVVRSK